MVFILRIAFTYTFSKWNSDPFEIIKFKRFSGGVR